MGNIRIMGNVKRTTPIHQAKINFHVATAVDSFKQYQFGRLLFRYWE